MYIDHDVLLSLYPFDSRFVFYPTVEISDTYLFIFLRMLQELDQLPYALEVLNVELDDLHKIPTAQLYSTGSQKELSPILDRYGFLLRKAAGIDS